MLSMKNVDLHKARFFNKTFLFLIYDILLILRLLKLKLQKNKVSGRTTTMQYYATTALSFSAFLEC